MLCANLIFETTLVLLDLCFRDVQITHFTGPLHKLGWRSSPGRVLVSGLLGHGGVFWIGGVWRSTQTSWRSEFLGGRFKILLGD